MNRLQNMNYTRNFWKVPNKTYWRDTCKTTILPKLRSSEILVHWNWHTIMIYSLQKRWARRSFLSCVEEKYMRRIHDQFNYKKLIPKTLYNVRASITVKRSIESSSAFRVRLTGFMGKQKQVVRPEFLVGVHYETPGKCWLTRSTGDYNGHSKYTKAP